jgi:serine/threonine-protein kinase
MNKERWERIKELFEATVEQPGAEREAFLAAATGADEALRREVESLLAADAADSGLLERLQMPADLLPAGFSTIAGMVGDTGFPPLLAPERRVGPYEVAGLLGAGAMGEVYRARDTRLNRDVALKVLPPRFALDPNRLARFRREAQVLAALKHPNIGAIYGR